MLREYGQDINIKKILDNPLDNTQKLENNNLNSDVSKEIDTEIQKGI